MEVVPEVVVLPENVAPFMLNSELETSQAVVSGFGLGICMTVVFLVS